MIYFMLDSAVATEHIKSLDDEGFNHVATEIIKKSESTFSNERCYLEKRFTIEDFSSSYDEMVVEFLKTCIPVLFGLRVIIQHEDGNCTITLDNEEENCKITLDHEEENCD